MIRQRHYKVSERKTLNKGDFFRVTGGPYYIGESGKPTSMASRGTMMFMYYCEKEGQHWIEAYSTKENCIVILSLDEGRESMLPGSYFPRPYAIRGGVSESRKERIIEKMGGKRALPAVRGRRGAVVTRTTEAPPKQSPAEKGREIVQRVLGVASK